MGVLTEWRRMLIVLHMTVSVYKRIRVGLALLGGEATAHVLHVKLQYNYSLNHNSDCCQGIVHIVHTVKGLRTSSHQSHSYVLL